MARFFGYDPGGYSKGARNGVVAIEIREDGSFDPFSRDDECVGLLRYANETICWFRERLPAEAMGVDTLLKWSLASRRTCDAQLRGAYPQHKTRIASQNSLMGAMAINGILVAQALGAKHGVILVESHPKLVVNAALVPECVRQQHERLIDGKCDHIADAFVAAWCASRWSFKHWTEDLYRLKDCLLEPAGPAIYPWPRKINTAKE